MTTEETVTTEDNATDQPTPDPVRELGKTIGLDMAIVLYATKERPDLARFSVLELLEAFEACDVGASITDLNRARKAIGDAATAKLRMIEAESGNTPFSTIKWSILSETRGDKAKGLVFGVLAEFAKKRGDLAWLSEEATLYPDVMEPVLIKLADATEDPEDLVKLWNSKKYRDHETALSHVFARLQTRSGL